MQCSIPSCKNTSEKSEITFHSESTKASTTDVQTKTSRKKIKSNAQRCREYRERKKLQKLQNAERSDERSQRDQLPAKRPKTDAERRKKYYEAQKLKKQKIKKIPKTAKQRNKEYYYRKKLRALNTLNHHSDAFGKQDTHQPDPGVVCSLHFLDDNFYKTEGCVRQIRSDAIPTTVLICVMCLDTDSKLVPMSKHQLEEVYQLLTGQTLFQLCETANLQQTLCVLCAQRLIHFRTFRHMSLRARSLIMDLVQKYKLITMQQIRTMKQATKELKSNLVSVALAPDHCDLYIYQSDADPQTELEQPVVADVAAVVKAEEHWDVPIGCVNIKKEYEADDLNNDSFVSTNEYVTLELNPVDKNTFTCSISEEIVREDQICAMCLDTDSKLVPMSKHQLEEVYQLVTGQTLFQLCETANLQQTLCVLCAQRLIHFRTFRHMSLRARSLIMDLVQKYNLITMKHVEMMKQATKELKSNLVSVTLAPDHCDLYIYQSDADPQTELEQPAVAGVAAVVKAEPSWDIPTDCVEIKTEYDIEDDYLNTSFVSNDESETLELKPFDEDNLARSEDAVLIQSSSEIYNKAVLDENNDTNSHTGQKYYPCDIKHKRIHIDDKPFSCEMCSSKFKQNYMLKRHMKIHSRETLYSCDICDYKTVRKYNLDKHKVIHVHTGEKPYSCDMCDYKTVRKCNLAKHKVIHTGEKNYSCDICDYKFARKTNLDEHKLTHTGERPHTCDICNLKFTRKSNLVKHKAVHTTEKPFSCDVCKYKTARKCNLDQHKLTHNAEKRYSCDMCSYKTAWKHSLAKHTLIHTAVLV